MSWATQYIAKLQAGETIQFRPRGNSMAGKVESGDLCTVAPANHSELAVGNIVLCKVMGRQYLHLIIGVRAGQYKIGNNRGGVNGWTTADKIYGIVTKVES